MRLATHTRTILLGIFIVVPALGTEPSAIAATAGSAATTPPTANIPAYSPSSPDLTSPISCEHELEGSDDKMVDAIPIPVQDCKPVEVWIANREGQLQMKGNATLSAQIQTCFFAPPPPSSQRKGVSIRARKRYVVGPVATVKLDGKGQAEPGEVGMLVLDDNGKPDLDPNFKPVVGVPGTIQPGHNTKSRPNDYGDPSIVGLPILGRDGVPRSATEYRVKDGLVEPNCQALSPTTRLLFENAVFATNNTYSNQVGIGNTSTPISSGVNGWNDTYQVGVGYSKKPILKQVRALFYPSNGRQNAFRDATFWDDAFWSAVTLDAAVSYGRAYTLQKGKTANALTTQPFYNVSVTYALDLERMWIHATKSDSRPAEPGYYYQAPRAGFFVDPGQRPDWPVAPWKDEPGNKLPASTDHCETCGAGTKKSGPE